MTTADHDDDAQVENDPTGVRALLSSLPDPGPMPDTVFARISASLQEEQERREQEATFGHDSAPDVISLAAERHRRRPMRTLTYLGAAAGLAVAATVVSTQLFGPGDGGGSGISADVGNTNARPTDAGAPGNAGEQEGADGAADEDTAADAGKAEDNDGDEAAAPQDDEVAAERPPMSAAETAPGQSELAYRIADDEVALTSTDFAADVSRWYTASPATADGTDSELANCLDVLGSGVSSDAAVLLAPGSLDGEPVVLALQTEPSKIAWALDASCVDGAGEILQGPSVIP